MIEHIVQLFSTILLIIVALLGFQTISLPAQAVYISILQLYFQLLNIGGIDLLRTMH